MDETKRLVHEKEYAVHAVAAALIEHGELIGSELEAVFEAADAANPEQAAAFERQLFTLPTLFDERGPAAAGATEWPAETGTAAAASWAALGEGGTPADHQPAATLYTEVGPVPPGDFHAPPATPPTTRPTLD